jgi:hypothetical protein
VRFQVLTAASMMFRAVFWVILPCRMIVDRLIPDDGGSTHLWNVGRQSFYTAVQPRRQLWTSFHTQWYTMYCVVFQLKYETPVWMGNQSEVKTIPSTLELRHKQVYLYPNNCSWYGAITNPPVTRLPALKHRRRSESQGGEARDSHHVRSTCVHPSLL